MLCSFVSFVLAFTLLTSHPPNDLWTYVVQSVVICVGVFAGRRLLWSTHVGHLIIVLAFVPGLLLGAYALIKAIEHWV